MHSFINYESVVHRLIPSSFPPKSLFDWADSQEELEQLAELEGFTNERLQAELGRINLVAKEDWVAGKGSTPLMAAFTHIGHASRFSDGSYGIYYAATSLETAIKETVFHRERFYKASQEKPCAISMREYLSHIKKPIVDIRSPTYNHLFHPDPDFYQPSQKFGKKIAQDKHWGLIYPSVRQHAGECLAIFRPNAITIPIQGCHLRYVWDGFRISAVYQESKISNF